MGRWSFPLGAARPKRTICGFTGVFLESRLADKQAVGMCACTDTDLLVAGWTDGNVCLGRSLLFGCVMCGLACRNFVFSCLSAELKPTCGECSNIVAVQTIDHYTKWAKA